MYNKQQVNYQLFYSVNLYKNIQVLYNPGALKMTSKLTYVPSLKKYIPTLHCFLASGVDLPE